MDQLLVKQLVSARNILADVLQRMKPAFSVEWDTQERVTRAHAILRSLDYDKLGQLPLSETPVQPEPSKDQLPLPDTAAVKGGEGSLNAASPPALAMTSDEEFDSIPSASRSEPPPQGIPPRRGRKHGTARD